ncbi:MAG: iron ABC transporter permease [Bacteroides sp.]|nr:iron ABC transporter permease [Bacteroides sp.]
MRFLILILLGAVLFLLNLFTGSVSIPAGDVIDILFHGDINNGPMDFIILGSRLPQALTALLAGSALTVAGLLLQTAFRNPLAGPSILGITSGAGLGVALVMLLLGGTISFAGFSAGGYVAVLIGALAGSLAVMALLLLFSVWLKSDLMLLIAGIMTGYLTSSVVTLLNYLSSAEGIQSFTMWGMGSFGSVSRDQLPVFSIAIGIGLLLSILLVKPLNIILLGENYARNLGISMQWVRNMLLVATGVLTSVVTAFCGPIGFIGLAVPHISRMIFRTSDHRVMIPGCILAGAVTGLLCNLLCILPRDMILPLNGVTPLIGVPVILYVIFKKR